MFEFPGQPERSLELRRKLGAEFDLAERILEFWMLTPKVEWLAQSAIPPQVIGVAMSLNVQACRLFRSVIELCSAADAHCADILARSLYETAIATCFVLQDEVRIRAVVRQKPNGQKKRFAEIVAKDVVTESSDFLSRDERAMLYMAYQPLLTEKRALELSNTDNFKNLAETISRKYSPELLAQIKSQVGETWTAILIKSKTYAGVTLTELAQVLGHAVEFWHKSFYFFQCRNAHGSDAAQHLDDRGEPVYLSDAGDVSSVLFAGISMFMLCLVAVQEHICFGARVDDALVGFRDEYHALM